jgi:hypothetical protein
MVLAVTQESMVMRVFVKYNRDGEVLSVSKVEMMPQHLEQPFGTLEDGVQFIEVDAKPPATQLSALELHEGYKVDVKKKKLVKKA